MEVDYRDEPVVAEVGSPHIDNHFGNSICDKFSAVHCMRLVRQ